MDWWGRSKASFRETSEARLTPGVGLGRGCGRGGRRGAPWRQERGDHAAASTLTLAPGVPGGPGAPWGPGGPCGQKPSWSAVRQSHPLHCPLSPPPGVKSRPAGLQAGPCGLLPAQSGQARGHAALWSWESKGGGIQHWMRYHRVSCHRGPDSLFLQSVSPKYRHLHKHSCSRFCNGSLLPHKAS